LSSPTPTASDWCPAGRNRTGVKAFAHPEVGGLGFGVYGAGLGDVVKIDLDLEFIEPA
jgi:hypothetical protein